MTTVPEPLVIDGPCGLQVDAACIDAAAWTEATPADREYALESARALLNSLTAGEVANCPVVIRPCDSGGCSGSADWSWNGVSWAPRLVGAGTWINTASCGCLSSSCGHEGDPEALRVPRAAEILEVWVDGAPLPSTSYRLQGGWLLRTDGQEWPQTQDMSADWEVEADTFAVVYRPGRPLTSMGERALGRLVAEFLKSCTTGKCALPSNMRTVSRQGVTFEIERDKLSDGVTGIRDVDYYTATINPNRLRQPSRVYVPGGKR